MSQATLQNSETEQNLSDANPSNLTPSQAIPTTTNPAAVSTPKSSSAGSRGGVALRAVKPEITKKMNLYTKHALRKTTYLPPLSDDMLQKTEVHQEKITLNHAATPSEWFTELSNDFLLYDALSRQSTRRQLEKLATSATGEFRAFSHSSSMDRVEEVVKDFIDDSGYYTHLCFAKLVISNVESKEADEDYEREEDGTFRSSLVQDMKRFFSSRYGFVRSIVKNQSKSTSDPRLSDHLSDPQYKTSQLIDLLVNQALIESNEKNKTADFSLSDAKLSKYMSEHYPLMWSLFANRNKLARVMEFVDEDLISPIAKAYCIHMTYPRIEKAMAHDSLLAKNEKCQSLRATIRVYMHMTLSMRPYHTIYGASDSKKLRFINSATADALIEANLSKHIDARRVTSLLLKYQRQYIKFLAEFLGLVKKSDKQANVLYLFALGALKKEDDLTAYGISESEAERLDKLASIHRKLVLANNLVEAVNQLYAIYSDAHARDGSTERDDASTFSDSDSFTTLSDSYFEDDFDDEFSDDEFNNDEFNEDEFNNDEFNEDEFKGGDNKNENGTGDRDGTDQNQDILMTDYSPNDQFPGIRVEETSAAHHHGMPPTSGAKSEHKLEMRRLFGSCAIVEKARLIDNEKIIERRLSIGENALTWEMMLIIVDFIRTQKNTDKKYTLIDLIHDQVVDLISSFMPRPIDLTEMFYIIAHVLLGYSDESLLFSLTVRLLGKREILARTDRADIPHLLKDVIADWDDRSVGHIISLLGVDSVPSIDSKLVDEFDNPSVSKIVVDIQDYAQCVWVLSSLETLFEQANQYSRDPFHECTVLPLGSYSDRLYQSEPSVFHPLAYYERNRTPQVLDPNSVDTAHIGLDRLSRVTLNLPDEYTVASKIEYRDGGEDEGDNGKEEAPERTMSLRDAFSSSHIVTLAEYTYVKLDGLRYEADSLSEAARALVTKELRAGAYKSVVKHFEESQASIFKTKESYSIYRGLSLFIVYSVISSVPNIGKGVGGIDPGEAKVILTALNPDLVGSETNEATGTGTLLGVMQNMCSEDRLGLSHPSPESFSSSSSDTTRDDDLMRDDEMGYGEEVSTPVENLFYEMGQLFNLNNLHKDWTSNYESSGVNLYAIYNRLKLLRLVTNEDSDEEGIHVGESVLRKWDSILDRMTKNERLSSRVTSVRDKILNLIASSLETMEGLNDLPEPDYYLTVYTEQMRRALERPSIITKQVSINKYPLYTTQYNYNWYNNNSDLELIHHFSADVAVRCLSLVSLLMRLLGRVVEAYIAVQFDEEKTRYYHFNYIVKLLSKAMREVFTLCRESLLKGDTSKAQHEALQVAKRVETIEESVDKILTTLSFHTSRAEIIDESDDMDDFKQYIDVLLSMERSSSGIDKWIYRDDPDNDAISRLKNILLETHRDSLLDENSPSKLREYMTDLAIIEDSLHSLTSKVSAYYADSLTRLSEADVRNLDRTFEESIVDVSEKVMKDTSFIFKSDYQGTQAPLAPDTKDREKATANIYSKGDEPDWNLWASALGSIAENSSKFILKWAEHLENGNKQRQQ